MIFRSKVWTAIAVVFLLVAMNAMADPKVKYCKNGQTGEVIVIEAGYACPFGTYQI